ncbi:MAG: DUF1963 domain-containing protein [Planctomycetaceae bacterium]|nr:DUF1963 domain-containing protein [Planctomycetaceae bacterium]
MSFDETINGLLRVGEREHLQRVSHDLGNASLLKEYGRWLQREGDLRGEFLLQFADGVSTWSIDPFPDAAGIDATWLDLIGYSIAHRLAERQLSQFAETVFGVARPALRFSTEAKEDDLLALGSSKFGGLPDLPAEFEWPIGDLCRATYNDDTAGEQRLAGFLGQINLDELQNAVTNDRLPKTGLLSFFGFQDMENDNPDKIGVMARWFPDRSQLSRRPAPDNLTTGNECFPSAQIVFTEFLDLPGWGSPWQEELQELINADEEAFDFGTWDNIRNMMGYAVATSGDEPTPDKQSQHLIFFPTNELTGWIWPDLHIQIAESNLKERRFEEIQLVWVDWD